MEEWRLGADGEPSTLKVQEVWANDHQDSGESQASFKVKTWRKEFPDAGRWVFAMKQL